MGQNIKATCPSGKIIYTSEAKARVASESLFAKKEWHTKIYKCDLGRHWHLTHSDADERRRDRKQKRRRERKVIRIAEKERNRDKRVKKLFKVLDLVSATARS